jgi:hypothetical protein
LDNTIVRAEDVIWRRIGDEIVVVKDDGLSIHVLNKTAAIIWEACADTLDPGAIAARLCEHYIISPDEAKNDVVNTMEKMEKIGLLKQTDR